MSRSPYERLQLVAKTDARQRLIDPGRLKLARSDLLQRHLLCLGLASAGFQQRSRFVKGHAKHAT